MTPERKVLAITGALRGIGAQLSKAYRPAAARPNPLH
jgi:NAD(P)-dependent dehydrogenase (short-subunit alcohol dehydrogenase family)